jgi:hypothetical protein
MSLDLEAKLRVFLASAPQAIHAIQVIEISHPSMSRTFWLWREPYAGTVTIDGVPRAVEAANIEIGLAGAAGHLDQRFDIRLGLVDSMDVFRAEIDRIPVNTKLKATLVYREYLSDDLVNAQATARLQVEAVSWMKGAANITAVSPRLNMTRTGQLYSPKEIPMLRGFL